MSTTHGKANITILTANILFGGLQIKQTEKEAKVFDWLLIHTLILRAKSARFVRRRLANNQTSLIKVLIDKKPDILVLNEIMPDISEGWMRELEESGFSISLGRAKHKPYPLATATVIASKYQQQDLSFSLPGNSGGGSCAVVIPELKVIVMAPHPSASKSRIRATQLKYTVEHAQVYISTFPKHDLVIAGDFNTDGEEIDIYFKDFRLKRYSLPSFPSPALQVALVKRNWWFMHKALRLSKEMGSVRHLDQIHVPRKWRNTKLQSLETTSDHMALLASFER